MNTNEAETTPVLIAGAGPVGLALAGDLGWRGIPCILVEQSDGSIYQPRMDLVGIRTMEFCRRWRLVDDVEASPYPRDYPQDNVYLTSMTGYELGREKFPAMGDASPPPQSPQRRERCPQNMFDPILQKFARSFANNDLRYLTRLNSFKQDEDDVTAEIEDLRSGRKSQIRAQYLVGCDGAHSMVRNALDIPMGGNPALTQTTNIIFRCPHLVSLHDKGRAYRYIFVGPEGTWATIVAINGVDQWRMSLIRNLSKPQVTESDIHAAIRRAVGTDFDYEIVSVMPWTRRELVAKRYGIGRCFIAGDAAHVMSPTGGFGMNTGIADAVDLSWKIAAVLEGWGDSALLESYDIERRPVGLRNVAEASRNLARMLSPGEEPRLLEDSEEGRGIRERVGRDFARAMSHEWHTLGVHLGYRYEPSPICWPEYSAAPPDRPDIYEQTTRAGARAPHAWLKDGRSTLDLFGRGFVLLAFDADAASIANLEDAAAKRALPLTVHRLSEPAVRDLYQCKLTLVRPDGHVAWRGERLPGSALELIDLVRGAGERRQARIPDASLPASA